MASSNPDEFTDALIRFMNNPERWILEDTLEGRLMFEFLMWGFGDDDHEIVQLHLSTLNGRRETKQLRVRFDDDPVDRFNVIDHEEIRFTAIGETWRLFVLPRA